LKTYGFYTSDTRPAGQDILLFMWNQIIDCRVHTTLSGPYSEPAKFSPRYITLNFI